MTPWLREIWRRHGDRVLVVVIGCMAAAALWRLSNELPRALFDADGAFDLRLRHREIHRWFAGLPVYDDLERGDYPPASYVILWPLLGWLSLAQARLLWALTSIVSLAVIARIAVRESGARSRRHMLLAALLPFSVYATHGAIGLGQIANHVVALLLIGLLLVLRSAGRWRDDLLVTAALLPALVKPPLSVPFFWIVALRPGRLRPIVLACAGYLLLTLLAISFQDGPLLARVTGWLAERPLVLQGHTNIHKVLALIGLRPWLLHVSFGILLATAWWIHRHRRADGWILLGVTALVAQFWMHHRLYDHVLMLVPMITLLRLSLGGPRRDGGDVVAGVLFALVWVTLLWPASLFTAPPPLPMLMEVGQALVWLTVLAFLLRIAHVDARVHAQVRSRTASAPEADRRDLHAHRAGATMSRPFDASTR